MTGVGINKPYPNLRDDVPRVIWCNKLITYGAGWWSSYSVSSDKGSALGRCVNTGPVQDYQNIPILTYGQCLNTVQARWWAPGPLAIHCGREPIFGISV